MEVIVGGGHNGLVAATLLARRRARRAAARAARPPRRRRRRPSARSPGRTPACRATRTSSRCSRDALARDLGIPLELADRSVAAYAPYDGRGLLVEQDATGAATRASFRERTGSDAEHDAFLRFYDQLGVAARLFPTFLEPLPTRGRGAGAARRRGAGWPSGRWASRWTSASPTSSSPGWSSTDGLIGTLADVDDAEPAPEPLLPLPRRRPDGRWRVPVGGMGAVSAARWSTPPARRAPTCAATPRSWRSTAPTSRGATRRRAHRHRRPRARQLRARRARPAARAAGAVPDPGPGRPAQGQPAARPPAGAALRPRPGGSRSRGRSASTSRSRTSTPPRRRAAARRAARPRCPAELYCHTLADPSIAPRPPHADRVRAARDPGDVAATRPTRARWTRLLDQLDEHLAEPIRDCLAATPTARRAWRPTPADLERDLAMPGGNIFHGDLDWPARGRPRRVGRRHRRPADPARGRGRPPRRRRRRGSADNAAMALLRG